MKYKAIIFDMDGTIISSEDLWTQGTYHLLKTTTNLPEQECKEILPFFKGASLYTTCRFIKENYQPKESLEELIAIKESFFSKQCKQHVSFIEGFEKFHDDLSKQGLVSAIGTNATLSSLTVILDQIPLKKFFNEHIYCVDHVGKKPKPHPDVFLHAANKLNVIPKECIVIEDSAHGIAAAKAAGMFCIGINTGKDRSALKKADLIIENYKEINLDALLASH